MLSRFCPNCGTEVDETAVFCPTCGQAIDQAAETAIPPAPAWPEPEPQPQREPELDVEADAEPEPPTADLDAPEVEPELPPRSAPTPPPPPAEAADRPTPAGVNLPLTTPLMLSGWLIGGGAALGALGALIGMFDGFVSPIELILLVALLAVAASVFLSSSMPQIPNLRLATLVVVLVAFGAAMDRLSIGGGFATLLLFLGTAAAAIGAVLVELGRDQPLGGA